MRFIHGEKGEQGPRISECLFRICNTCMEQGISMVKKEDLGFQNYSFNVEAAQFLGGFFKSMWQQFCEQEA